MQRHTNWPSALGGFLQANRRKAFDWKTWNCCTLAAGAVQAMTGVDIAADFSGYTDEASAWAKVKAVTGGTDAAAILTYVSKKYGLQLRKAPAFAQRGDLVLLRNAAAGAAATVVGIVGLDGRPVAVSDTLHTFPMSAVIAAYQV